MTKLIEDLTRAEERLAEQARTERELREQIALLKSNRGGDILADKEVQDSLLDAVREAVRASMVPWVEAQADGFQQWMLAALESVQRTKADPLQVEVIEELRDQFIREREAGLPPPPPVEPAAGDTPRQAKVMTRRPRRIDLSGRGRKAKE